MTYLSTTCPLTGTLTIDGDKSISHRSVIFSGIASGTSTIKGLLLSEDVLATKAAMEAMGVIYTQQEDGSYVVEGVGVNGLSQPQQTLDMGNTGTGVRLLMGLVASHDFTTSFTGDKSLCSRPMGRVLTPLSQCGLEVISSADDYRLPITIKGSSTPAPITYTLPVASAQVKSAILLAGLNIAGTTTVIEPVATRDHTERMLTGLGATITSQKDPATGHHVIALKGKQPLTHANFEVPADPSSAAFLIVAALITEGSEVTIKNVCMNEGRTGLYTTLIEMGATITYHNERVCAGESIADITASYSQLHGIEVPAERAPSMIDEYPILGVAASVANGTTVMHGLEELKVKESNRLDATLNGLLACGVTAQAGEDTLTVTGGPIPGGCTITTHMDHRIAMSFLIAGLVSDSPIKVDDVTMIATSFPNFFSLLEQLSIRVNES